MTEVLPHQQRVIDEKRELDERLARLRAFLLSPTAADLAPREQQLLDTQSMAMELYSRALGQRLGFWGVAS
jgi:hypothetical protein